MQSDFATTDAPEAAELDDGRLDLSGSIYHDINDPPLFSPRPHSITVWRRDTPAPIR
jgi:hypothetical protein